MKRSQPLRRRRKGPDALLTAKLDAATSQAQGTKPRRGVVKTCPQCKCEFYVRPSVALRQKFCSMPCYTAARTTGKERHRCKHCGETYETYPSQRRARGTSFCSRECKHAHRAKQHPKLQRTYCDNHFSRYIRMRDGMCVRCGKTEALQCAHILTRSVSVLRCDPENAITLCVRCHLYWWHKDPIAAGRWFDETWPGRYDSLTLKAQQVVKVNWQDEFQKIQQLVSDLTGEPLPTMGKPRGTHCAKGHPLHVRKDGNQKCRECHRLREKKRRAAGRTGAALSMDLEEAA